MLNVNFDYDWLGKGAKSIKSIPLMSVNHPFTVRDIAHIFTMYTDLCFLDMEKPVDKVYTAFISS